MDKWKHMTCLREGDRGDTRGIRVSRKVHRGEENPLKHTLLKNVTMISNILHAKLENFLKFRNLNKTRSFSCCFSLYIENC